MLEELKQRLLDCHEDKNVRVAIIDHNGPVFSSGHDLKELVSLIKCACTIEIQQWYITQCFKNFPCQ